MDKDQVLLRLDGAGIEEDLKRAQEQKRYYDMQTERLRAFIEHRAPSFPSDVDSDLLRDQEEFFQRMTEATQREISVIDDQIVQKKRALDVLEADLQTAEQNYTVIKELYARRAELNRQGYLPDVQFLETKQGYIQTEGLIRNLQSQVDTAKSAIAEYESRRASAGADNMNEASQKLDGILSNSAQNDQVIEKLKDRVARLEVKAPVKGIVKGIAVNTVGAVVQPGQELMQIVPTGAVLIVTLKIPPRYVGNVRVGQPVQVKFSSFDFSRYGSVSGKLDFVSAATFTGENGERYYQGRASLDREYVGNKSNQLIPGMTVMADIVTGDKTVLEYLFKPIRNAISTAFTER